MKSRPPFVPRTKAAATAAFLACVLLACALVAWAAPAVAEDSLVDPSNMPGPLSQVSVDQKLGDFMPLDAELVDAQGQTVKLGDYFGDRPVILAFVYYECPMLCSLIMNGVASSLSILSFVPGEEFDVVAISIDHEETPEMARKARQDSLQRYGRPDADGWHFLTGDEDTVRRVAAAAGFGFEYIPATDEWAHGSAIMVATPEGQLAQYFYGVEYPPKDLRLALVEASNGEIGSLVDQILLYCYRYDPEIGQYTVLTMRILRIAGATFAFGLIIYMWISFRRDKRDKKAQSPTLGAA